jgi:hypothetical protein
MAIALSLLIVVLMSLVADVWRERRAQRPGVSQSPTRLTRAK